MHLSAHVEHVVLVEPGGALVNQLVSRLDVALVYGDAVVHAPQVEVVRRPDLPPTDVKRGVLRIVVRGSVEAAYNTTGLRRSWSS